MEASPMRKHKRIAGILLALLAVLLVPAPVFAAGSIDLTHDCTLTVSYQDEGTPITGAAFSIYLTAKADQNGALTPTETFSQYNVNLRGGDMKKLASTLEGYVLRDGIAPEDSGVTDEQGKLLLPEGDTTLVPGLYLVLGQRHEQNGKVYDVQPFMVQLPASDQGSNWLYDVIADVKYNAIKKPDGLTVTRKVLKVWKDDGHEESRPKEIVVQLLKDGEVCDTVTLTAENQWGYTWENLDASSYWLIVEKNPQGYAVETTLEGITFVVTNTYQGTTPGPSPSYGPTPSPDRPGPSPSYGPTPSPDQPGPTPSYGPTPTPDQPTPTPSNSLTPATNPPQQSPSVSPSTPPGVSNKPSTSTPPSSGRTSLPQTGQLWWPVPLMLAVGLLLIAIGLLRRRGYEDEKK